MKTITKSISVLALAAGFTFSSLSGTLPFTHEQTASAAEKINAPFSVYEVTANVLNIRSKPSTQGKILDTLRKKDQIEVVKFVNADWAAIKIIGGTGYISTSYLMKVPSTVHTAANLNLRTGPSTSNKVVTTIPKGKSVSFLAWGYSKDNKLSFDWAFVEYNGFKGYVSTSYLQLPSYR